MRDFEWPNGVHVRVVEPLTTYAVRYSDPGALEVDLVFEAFMAPNLHPDGVVPFLKGAHFDQAGHVTGTMVLHGEEVPVDCYSVRDRSWGPRPMGRPKRRSGRGRSPSREGVGSGILRRRRLLVLRGGTRRSVAHLCDSRPRGGTGRLWLLAARR